MIAKSLIAAAAVATTMAVAMPVTQAEAKTKVNIDINLGFGDGYYGYGHGHHHHKKNYGYVSCHKGAKIVDWSGFHKVHAIDCKLPGYKYTAWKKGHKYMVKVNGHGNIYSVHKIF